MRSFKHDLFPGEPDLSIFPMSRWLTAMRKVADRGLAPALTYDPDEGSTDCGTLWLGTWSAPEG